MTEPVTENTSSTSSADSRHKREEFEKNTEKTLAAHFTVSGLFIFLSFLHVFKRVPVYNSTALGVDAAEFACSFYLFKLSKDSWKIGKRRAAIVAAVDGGLSLYQAATGLISNNFWSFWSKSQIIGQASVPWLYTANAIQAWAVAINTGISLYQCYQQRKNPQEFVKYKLEEAKICNDSVFVEEALKIAKVDIHKQLHLLIYQDDASREAEKIRLITIYAQLFKDFFNEQEITAKLKDSPTSEETAAVTKLYEDLEKRYAQLHKEFAVALFTALASSCLVVDKQHLMTMPEEVIEASIYTIFGAAVMVAILLTWGAFSKCVEQCMESVSNQEPLQPGENMANTATDEHIAADLGSNGNLIVAAGEEEELEPGSVTVHC